MKVTKTIKKEEKLNDLNKPLVIIEEDSALTKKNVISYTFNKDKRSSTIEEAARKSNHVGPGAYDPNINKKVGPGFEEKIPRLKTDKNMNPGVGMYDINDPGLKVKITAPKYGIPKAEKKDPFGVDKKQNTPGIGSYNISKTDKNRFYTDKNMPRFSSPGNNTPGIGTYNINDAELKLKKRSPRAITAKEERKDPFGTGKEKLRTPGVGAYNLSQKQKNTFYMDSNIPRFNNSVNGVPSVGEYDINDAELKLKTKAPGAITSKEQRNDPFGVGKDKKKIPGVGSYNVSIKEKNKFYTEQKIPRFGDAGNGVPGIGSYDINDNELKLKKRSPRAITAKEERKDPFGVGKDVLKNPGAGTYNVNQKSKNTFYMEQNIPRFGNAGNGVPSVGEYDINDAELKLKKKAPSAVPSKAERNDPFGVGKDKKKIPGAGAYNINIKEKNNFYTDQNIPRFGDAGNGVPGIGSYDINDNELKLKKRSPRAITAKEERKDPFGVGKDRLRNPGPGNYNLNLKKKNTFYMDSNIPRFNNSVNGVPSVGEYDINEAEIKLKRRSPGAVTAKEGRNDPFGVGKDKKKIPGVGSYNVSIKDKNRFYTDQNIPRFSNATNGVPGIGSYDINDNELKLKKRVPGAVTSKEQRNDPFGVGKDKKKIPGVGSYNISIKDKNRFYTDQNIPRFGDAANGVPGIGSYDINDNELKLKKRAPAAVSSKEGRNDPFGVGKDKKKIPGVGSYNVSIKDKNRFYTDQNIPRFGDAANGVPGIGSYDINDAALKLKTKAPGAVSSKEARKDLFGTGKLKTPGAGTYNVTQKNKNNFYMEQNIPRFSKAGNGVPSVGEYDINDAELKLKKKAPGAVTSKEQRNDPFGVGKDKKKIPGVGSYNINIKNKNNFYTDQNIPRFSNTANGVPGIGSYDINDNELKLKKRSPRAVSAKEERKDPFGVGKDKKKIPGAGAYNISLKNKNNFYMDENIPRFNNSVNGVPSVGEYNINDAELKLKKKSPGAVTSKEQRNDPFGVGKDKKKIPGVGSYNISIKDKNRFYTDEHIPRFNNSGNGVPGIGSYDINDAELKLRSKSPRAVTSKEARKDPFGTSKIKTPGAGAYNVNVKNKNTFYMEKNIPRFSNSGNGVPSVGEYDINDAELKLKKRSPGAVTGKEGRNDPFGVGKDKKKIPGAGAYNVSIKNKNNFYMEENIPRFSNAGNGVPSVGEYDINDAELKLKKKAPGAVTSKEQRNDPFGVGKYKKTIPGAGAYNVSIKNKNNFYMEENIPRFSNTGKGVPSVGEYNINEAELKLKKKTGGISTVKEERKDPFDVAKDKKKIPGAGAYNTLTKEEGKFYIEKNIPRFGGKGKNYPGVGSYDINDPEINLKKKNPAYGESKSKREDPFNTKTTNERVGPGTYEVKVKSTKTGQQKFSTIDRKL